MSELDLAGPTFELLFERSGLPSFPLPAPLLAAYGGALGFESPRVFANFVSSVDGVVRTQQRRRMRILGKGRIRRGDEGHQATECHTGIDRRSSWLDSRAIARLCSLEID